MTRGEHHPVLIFNQDLLRISEQLENITLMFQVISRLRWHIISSANLSTTVARSESVNDDLIGGARLSRLIYCLMKEININLPKAFPIATASIRPTRGVMTEPIPIFCRKKSNIGIAINICINKILKVHLFCIRQSSVIIITKLQQPFEQLDISQSNPDKESAITTCHKIRSHPGWR